MVLTFCFKNGVRIDVGTEEFAPDGIGTVIDHFAGKHGGVIGVEVSPDKDVGPGPAAREVVTAKDTAVQMVEGMSHQDRVRVLANVIWEVFGDLDQNDDQVLLPGRSPGRDDLNNLVAGLREEFFPGVMTEDPHDAALRLARAIADHVGWKDAARAAALYAIQAGAQGRLEGYAREVGHDAEDKAGDQA